MVAVFMIYSLTAGDLRRILIVVLCVTEIGRPVLSNIDHDPHSLERILELIEERLAVNVFPPHLEQEAQTCMSWVRINAMFANNFVVCFEERSEWEPVDFRFALSAGDNLVEETDICKRVRFCSRAV